MDLGWIVDRFHGLLMDCGWIVSIIHGLCMITAPHWLQLICSEIEMQIDQTDSNHYISPTLFSRLFLRWHLCGASWPWKHFTWYKHRSDQQSSLLETVPCCSLDGLSPSTVNPHYLQSIHINMSQLGLPYPQITACFHLPLHKPFKPLLTPVLLFYSIGWWKSSTKLCPL